MVGPIMFVKLVPCKQICLKSSSENYHSDNIKSEPQEEDQRICRICLKDGHIPIYGNTTEEEDISEAINLIGGINVQSDDQYPKYICYLCHSLLQSAISFRKTAQQSDLLLKQPITQASNIKNDDDEENSTLDDNEYLNDNKTFTTTKLKAKKTKTYHCKDCDLDFSSLTEYSEHKQSKNHANIRYLCQICNKTYTRLYFKRHMEIHKADNFSVCDICGKNFTALGYLTRHRQTHFYDLPYKCEHCPYKGRFKESLKMHMRTHTGERPYQCTECPSRFVSKSNLSKHLKTHSGIHDFKCDSCEKGFYTKRELDLHMKGVHSGIKDHSCDICGKSYGYRKLLLRHQLKVHKRKKLRGGLMPVYLQVENMKQDGNDTPEENIKEVEKEISDNK